MRSTCLLLFSATVLIASEPVARPDSIVALTPTAAEAVKQARQYETTVMTSAASQDQGGNTSSGVNVPGRRTRVVVRPDGSLRAYLGEEHMNNLVAVRSTDGRISTTCGTDADPKTVETSARAEEK